jgi:hypothetical protein
MAQCGPRKGIFDSLRQSWRRVCGTRSARPSPLEQAPETTRSSQTPLSRRSRSSRCMAEPNVMVAPQAVRPPQIIYEICVRGCAR